VDFLGDGHFEHGHYVVPTKGAGIFGHCTHILCDAARIGSLFFQRYQFTRDETWLRDRAYPVVRGAAEFYRNFPNVRKEDDGRYHIHHVNNNESGWDTSDTPMEITGMRTAFTNAIAASKILKVEDDLRPKWQEMLDHLAEPNDPGRGRRPARPTGGDAGAPGGAATAPVLAPTSREAASGVGAGRGGNRPFGAFVYGGPGVIPANEPEAELKSRFLGFNATGSFIDVPGIGGAQIFRNRMRLREGPGATDAEHIGGLAAGIHSTLLNSTTDEQGHELIEVFGSAWPRSWECAFQLLAHGGFIVSSSVRNHEVEFVEIRSQLGGPCRLKNPWPSGEVTTVRGGSKGQPMSGDVLSLETSKGETVRLLRPGATPEQVRHTIP
jgi:hypothetical protein